MSLTVRPVAYMMVNKTHGHTPSLHFIPPENWHATWEAVPLYAAPPTISKTETVEPAAWMWDYKRLDGHVETKVIFAKHYKHSPGDLAYVLEGKDAKPLYTAPPNREPLTDEEIKRIDDNTHFHESTDWYVRFARAVERAHGIGGKE